MTKPRHETRSPRLAPPNSSTSSSTSPKSQRHVGWAISITLIGWIVVAAPVAAMGILAYLLIFSANGESDPAGIIFQGILSGAMMLCMIAFPVFLGLAVMKRSRGLWIGAITTGALSVATLIYVSLAFYGAPAVSS